jgi:hypothetical protein
MGAVSTPGGARVGNGGERTHVMVLPDGPGDDDLAVHELEQALDSPGVVIMLVVGDDERSERIVGWASPLCVGSGAPGRGPERRVIQVRDPGQSAVGAFLAMLLGSPLPRVAVWNSREWVRVRIAEHEAIDAGVLEQAFLRG